MRRLTNVAIGAAIAVLALAAFAAGAGANVGVGITAAPITLAKPAEQGQTYKLPGVYVVNTGSQSGAIHVSLASLEKTKKLPIPASWVTFHPSTVTLGPKKGTVIPITLAVPSGAEVGDYQSDIEASAVSSGTASGTGTHVGAAAATRFLFTVTKAKPAQFHVPSWVWIALAVVVIVGLLVWLIKASGVRLSVERRDKGSPTDQE
ncbi:MAG TPA: hypothetical protein VMT43_08820 [Acidimicrobiales bacterium]|nr:hypothetical protein [Acidimicrobiales bacterium]